MKDEALVQFKLLLPAALKKRLETHATLNRRSLSQEIVVALEEKYPAAVPDDVRSCCPDVVLARQTNPSSRSPQPGSRQRQASRPIRAHCGRYFAERMKDIGD